MNPYTVHDASHENKGLPTWNVKGPGYDRLVYRHMGNAINRELVRAEAERLAGDLNVAYAEGVKAGREAQ